MPIGLDLNNPDFQSDWFALEKEGRHAVLNCCAKLASLEWPNVYRDKGLRWELIQSRSGPGNDRLYSIRVSQKIRAVVLRKGNYLQFLSLHADHDSAYE
jgi:hypothetical protein